jgi:predicted DNA-binding transcriptional regulator AlpA
MRYPQLNPAGTRPTTASVTAAPRPRPLAVQRDVQDIARRIHRLAAIDQLYLYETLRDHLVDATTPETSADAQVRLELESLDAIRAVAAHLGLPDRQAPNSSQYRAVYKELAPEWSVTRISELHGRWRFAVQTYEGKRLPLSASQIARKRAASGKDSGHVPSIEGVKQWLDTKPGSTTQSDYDVYVARHNDRVLRDRSPAPLLKSSNAVRSETSLPWPMTLAVAGGSLDYETAFDEALRRRLAADAGPLGLVGAEMVAMLTGDTRVGVREKLLTGTLPQPVVCVGTANGWLEADIRAHAQGQPYPSREPLEMQPLVMGTQDIAIALGLSVDSVRTFRHKAQQTGIPSAAIPPSDGRIGAAVYWVRETAEQWIRDHARPPRQKSKRRRRRT